MGQMEDLRLFIQVASSGSISKAAAELGIAKSAVSRRLSLLEDRYGSRLVDRSPGRWDLTETGRELFQRASRVVSDVDDIEDDFLSSGTAPSGPLSISIPRDFGHGFLNTALIDFQAGHPEVQLTVDFDDRLVDLARENYDFAIRITDTRPDDAIALKLGTVEHCLFASPGYLRAHPAPQSIDDLQQHRLLHFGWARRAVWEFQTHKGKRQRLEFQPALNSNSGTFLLEATVEGYGISRLPDFIATDALAAGKLAPLLPDIAEPAWGIYLLHARERRLNRRMRLFAEEIRAACLSGLGNEPETTA
ncbi:LysR family transcriptional regulator [Stappia sp. BW2]|uniref:LysR family transcriptional regulator n=1 Tax=Stappia sp. BW2 TaxID=2592622 RepID=UPI001AD8CB7E|nr:LysR family transcriptional regulator [Stappia sp. BW2]